MNLKRFVSMMKSVKVTNVSIFETPRKKYNEAGIVEIEVYGTRKQYTIDKNLRIYFLTEENEIFNGIQNLLNQEDKNVFQEAPYNYFRMIIINRIERFVVNRKIFDIEYDIQINFDKLVKEPDYYIVAIKMFYKDLELEVDFTKYKKHRGIKNKDGQNFEEVSEFILLIYNDFFTDNENDFLTTGVEEKIFSVASGLTKDIITKKFKETKSYKMHCLYNEELLEILG